MYLYECVCIHAGVDRHKTMLQTRETQQMHCFKKSSIVKKMQAS